MIFYTCITETLVIACTVSEILAPIDHEGPNWTFLTLKMTFILILHLSYFKTGLISHQRKLNDAINLGSTSLLLNNIDNYRKMGQT